MRDQLISVIVPIYNVEPYLRKCLDSIINQTYSEMDIILVDDGSSDNCSAICDEYAVQDSRIHVIHQGNGGVSEARNAGLGVAQGEYIMFIDGDDWIERSYVERFMKATPFDIAITGYTSVDENNCREQIIADDCRNLLGDADLFERIVRNSIFGFAWCKAYRADIISQLSFQGFLREDFIFNVSAWKRAKDIVVINDVGYNYRQRASSLLHAPYSGSVPNLIEFPMFLVNEFHVMDNETNRRCGDYVIKTYMVDTLLKYVIKNRNLIKKEKKAEFKKVILNRSVRKYLKIRLKEENHLYQLLSISIKIRMPLLLFYIMQYISNE